MQYGLCLEHYIISSGIEEMIRGCAIFEAFTEVFASKFIYADGAAAWPGVAINYTTKTQYLFRINKGIDNHWDACHQPLHGRGPASHTLQEDDLRRRRRHRHPGDEDDSPTRGDVRLQYTIHAAAAATLTRFTA